MATGPENQAVDNRGGSTPSPSAPPLWTNWKSRQAFTLDMLRVRTPSAARTALWCNGKHAWFSATWPGFNSPQGYARDVA